MHACRSTLEDPTEPLSSIRKDLSRDLGPIVDRCLEKDPRRRFQTALEVRNELGRVQQTLRSRSEGTSATGSPSIAVLPFVNMSRDEENEYFSDGLSEELLNVLAKIPELKVTGRTSSFAFKGKQEDLRDIGQKLGVATLLEGSVRKAGNRVRITAQLIKASDGFHLWSETYDRVLDDIFAVQDDIARSVSQALHVTLLGAPAPSRGNAEAFSLVLQARHFSRQSTGPAVAKAISLFQEAIEKSPDHAPAWAGLALAHEYAAGYGHADLPESVRSARAAAERALSLDPALAEAYTAMGTLLASFDFRFREGMELIRKSVELAPGGSTPLVLMSLYEGCLGSSSESVRLARRAQEIDPLSAEAHLSRGRAELWAGNLEAACEAWRKVLELSPGATSVHGHLGMAQVRLGVGESAIAEIMKETAPGYRYQALAIAYHRLGKEKESDEAMARLLQESEMWGIQFASAHAVRGEIDEAFRWLERSYELHDSGVVMLRVNSSFQNLHSDPRWPRLLKKIGLAD